MVTMDMKLRTLVWLPGPHPLLQPPHLLLLSSFHVLQVQNRPPESTLGLFIWKVLPLDHHLVVSSVASRSWFKWPSQLCFPESLFHLHPSMSCYLCYHLCLKLSCPFTCDFCRFWSLLPSRGCKFQNKVSLFHSFLYLQNLLAYDRCAINLSGKWFNRLSLISWFKGHG